MVQEDNVQTHKHISGWFCLSETQLIQTLISLQNNVHSLKIDNPEQASSYCVECRVLDYKKKPYSLSQYGYDPETYGSKGRSHAFTAYR